MDVKGSGVPCRNPCGVRTPMRSPPGGPSVAHGRPFDAVEPLRIQHGMRDPPRHNISYAGVGGSYKDPYAERYTLWVAYVGAGNYVPYAIHGNADGARVP